jgi:sugar phosphate isomerase/epimerase
MLADPLVDAVIVAVADQFHVPMTPKGDRRRKARPGREPMGVDPNIDPANLFRGGDLDRQCDTLREVELLGDDLVLAHAKDVRTDGTFVAAGRGEFDYPLYLTLLGHTAGNVPLILHGLAEDEVPGSVVFLRAALAHIPAR